MVRLPARARPAAAGACPGTARRAAPHLRRPWACARRSARISALPRLRFPSLATSAGLLLLVLPAILPAHRARGGELSADEDPLGAALAGEEEWVGGGEPALGGFPDPLEPLNRKVFAFNRVVDRIAVRPVTRVYLRLVPAPVRQAVRRVFANLDAPATIANDLLQMEGGDAVQATARFAVNSTLGIGGLFDPASRLGLPAHSSDFGQTLALAGVGSGPYLVLPLLGPTCVRDALGDVVDLAFRPVLYVLAPGQQLLYGGGYGLSAREAHAEELEALEQSAVDYYAALRNALGQHRKVEIWGRRASHRGRRCAEAPCGPVR